MQNLGGGCPQPLALAWQNLLSSLLFITYMQTPHFHAIAHSFAQREAYIYPVVNNLRTLSIAIGVVPPSVSGDWGSYDSRAARSEAL